MQEAEMPANIQALANGLDTTFYISHLSPDHADYGKSNNDETFVNDPDPYPDDAYTENQYSNQQKQHGKEKRVDRIL